MTVVCPNCGSEITVPKRKKKFIKCPSCDMDGLEFGLDYFDENDDPKLSPWEKFSKEHPKVAKGLETAGALAILGLAVGSAIKSGLDNIVEEVPPDNNSILPDENHPVAESVPENTPPLVNPENYDSVLHKHGLSLRNLGENRFHSPEKEKQATDLGIKLNPHQTIVNPFPRHYRVKKSD